MSLIRPDIRDALIRWREVIAGAVFVAIGLRLILDTYGALFLIGCGLFLAGLGLVFAGVQRARFRTGGGGAGVVDVDERRITYFGPFGGGAVAVDDLVEVGADPSRSWLLRDAQGTHLMIPMNAEGADQLFDALTVLPGLSAARLIDARRAASQRYTTLWEKPQPRLH